MEGREDIFAEMKEKFWPTFKVSQAISALIYVLGLQSNAMLHISWSRVRSNIYSFSFGKSFFYFLNNK